jgi:hypothetical protein
MKDQYIRPGFTPLGRDEFVAGEMEALHRLNNKLGIILGECALLAQDASDPRFLTRLQSIQKAAHSMGDEIASQQRRMAEVIRDGLKNS